MNSIPVVYPPSPESVPEAANLVSGAFRQQVGKVMTSIVLFFIVYLLLISLAILLALFTVYAGVAIIIALPKFLTLMLGLGLIGLGIMVLFFMIKFVFAVSRFDKGDSVEIKEADQPELFAFIRQLSMDTATSFPKKIFVSADVNASVSYNSSFWSMFLPVRKNLQIGLGLVNVLTVSEFKAVIAHEFGHFSQRSMKLGSFVYNVNRVIYNMLYNNSGYGNTLNVWANIHSVFAIFANLTVKIVQGIQWILHQQYQLINQNYMGLSREMEFHADAVAAGVAGSDSLASALRRLDLANVCYETVISKYDKFYKEKLIGSNLYNDQQTVLAQIASEQKIELRNNIALVTDSHLAAGIKRRVNYKDQWASHPPVEERTARLEVLDIRCGQMDDSAWLLFRDREKLQQDFTRRIYQQVQIPEDAADLDAESFKRKYTDEQQFYRLPGIFKGYFDNREPKETNHEQLVNGGKVPVMFNDSLAGREREEIISLPKTIEGLRADVEILEMIVKKQLPVSTFDFDGQKHHAADAGMIRDQLSAELKIAEEKLDAHDADIFAYCYQLAMRSPAESHKEVISNIDSYFALQKDADLYLAHINTTLELIAPFYSDGSLTLEVVNNILSELKNEQEPAFKIYLTKWLQVCDFEKFAELKEKIIAFMDKDYRYFVDNSLMDNELDEYNYLLRESWILVWSHKFTAFRHLLERQATLISAASFSNQ